MLALKLTAEPADGENENLVLPVVGPDATARVTMWPTNKNDTPYFARNYLPAGGQVVFTFAAAQCKRLFPYVTNAMGYNTGLAITNATASTNNPVDGTILFTLFPNHAQPFEYLTGAGSPRGNGGLGRRWSPSCREHLHCDAQRASGCGCLDGCILWTYCRADQFRPVQWSWMDN